MDLSFTKDPEWLEHRTKLWDELEADLKDGLSRKEVERWKAYFFTGLLSKGKYSAPIDLLNYFPKLDDEGIQYCLQHVVKDKVTDDQFWSVQALFAGSLNAVPGLTTEDALILFKRVFGDKYESDRSFPYSLFGEDEYRKIDLSPNMIFAYGTSIYSYIKRPTDNLHFWIKLPEFFMSLLSHVDERFFNKDIDTTRASVGGANIERTQLRFQAIMRWAVSHPEQIYTTTHKEAILAYLSHVKSGLDSLDQYPGQLKELWDEIKGERSS